MKNKKKEKKRKKIFTFGLGKERDDFLENISMLISGGVPIFEAIESIKEGSRSKDMKKLLDYMREDIEDGLPIWKSFSKTNLFPDHVISLVRLGEESGKLNENIKIAAIGQEKNRALQSKIYSAMMYPAFVLFLTVFVGLGIAWLILPRLTTTFAQMRMDLPLITEILIEIGNFLGSYGHYFIPSFLVFLVILVFVLFYLPKTKFIGQAVLFIIPGVGKLVKELEIARFGHLLGTLLGAGVSIRQAMFLLSRSTASLRYKRLYKHLENCIGEGDTFKKSFSSFKGADKLMSRPIQQLIFVGEKSGSLSEVLLDIGRKFEEKTDNTTKNLTVILEPLMLVIVSLGVAFVAIAIILPIYSLIGGMDARQQVVQEIATPVEEVPFEETEVETGKIRGLDVDPENLIVYSEPSYGSEMVGQIMPGEEAEYIEKENGWYKILLLEDETGWISGSYIEVVNDEEQ